MYLYSLQHSQYLVYVSSYNNIFKQEHSSNKNTYRSFLSIHPFLTIHPKFQLSSNVSFTKLRSLLSFHGTQVSLKLPMQSMMTYSTSQYQDYKCASQHCSHVVLGIEPGPHAC